MASLISQLTSALCTLPYPLPQNSLEQEFVRLQRFLPPGASQSEVDALLSAFDEARNVNITFISALLQQISTAMLQKLATKSEVAWTVPGLKGLKRALEQKLLKTAMKYMDLTMESTPRLKVGEIATYEIRELVAMKGDAMTELLTKEIIESAHRLVKPELAGRTQVQILSLGCTGVLRPHLDSCFERLLDVHRLPQPFERKLLKRIAKLHFRSLLPVVRETFEAELSCCTPSKPADWDIDPNSEKGSHMLLVASVAHSLQPDGDLALECLGRVMTWDRYQTPKGLTVRWQPLLECVCRLYIGLLGLSKGLKTGEIASDPEIYIWMRRVMRKLYEYPKETAFFENRFLNVINEYVARILKRHSAFHQNLRYCLPATLSIPHSRQDPKFLKMIYDSVEFRYLSELPSISSMLHISGAKDSNTLDAWPLITGLHVSKDVLQWRSTDTAKLSSQSVVSIASLPLTLLNGWFLAIPVLLRAVADVTVSWQEAMKKKERKAMSVGVFLGLLLAHGEIRNRFQSLFGFCFGAQIVLACLAELGEFNRRSPKGKRVYINDVILLLGAADADAVDWELVTEPVRGRFINLFYPRNDFFSSAFGASMKQPIGSHGICRSGIEDVDVTDAIEEELSRFQSEKKAPNAFKKIAKLISYYP